MTEFQQTVINLIEDGMTVSEIAKQLGKNKSSVSSVVKRFNLTPKKAYINTVNSEFFDTIDSQEKAYLLGFFIADCCINKTTNKSNGRLGIAQSEDDKEIVEAFKQYLNIPSEIQIINNQNGAKHRKIQYRIRWTSVHMKKILEEKYNITSNKTLDSEFEFPIDLVPKTLQGHFVRGFIDGDGYMGNNGQECNFSISIVGTSIKFITLLGDLVSNATNMSYKLYKTHGKTCNYYNLRWSCDHKDKLNKTIKLKNYLYNNATIFLKRKKEKIDHYIEYRANSLNNINEQCNALEVNQ